MQLEKVTYLVIARAGAVYLLNGNLQVKEAEFVVQYLP